jgi:hypothetical protein
MSFTTDAAMEVEIQYMVELNNSLTRLKDNQDFKRLILEGYFKDFAVNQTSMLATDYVRKTGTRPEVMERLVAISNLQDWFITIEQLGTIPQDEDEE